MYKTLYPTRDATLYSRYPERNTGADQIIELTKVASGSTIDDIASGDVYWDTNYNTRMLLDFDLSTVSASIVAGDIANARFFLTLKATEAIHLPISYTLYTYPVRGSWTNGTGYFDSAPEVTNGASWLYTNGKGEGSTWDEAGGDFYSSSIYEASQLFNYESPDARIEVSNIVNAWLSGSITQNGFIVKHHTTVENDSSEVGSIKFFAKDTHTVYMGRLEVFWDDVDVSGTGSISAITGEQYVVYAKNLKAEYYEDETPKIRFGVRDRFPTKAYSTTNANLTTSRLPYNSYFQIMDSRTDEVIIPFDSVGTRVSCDATGTYIRLDINSLLAERFYKIIVKVESDGSTDYIDDGFWFKVRRK
tara:strand:- start:15 stop:1097 length:1083 start_codon:yes stop_codon:yes gene_type:complete